MKNMQNSPAEPSKIHTELPKVQERASRCKVQEHNGKPLAKDNSPARSSVKSLQSGRSTKAVVDTKASIKSIPNPGNRFNKAFNKAENKSLPSKTSLYSNGNQKATANSSVSRKNNTTTVMKPASPVNANTPNGRSRIPAMKRTLNSLANNDPIHGKAKTAPQQKPPLKTARELRNKPTPPLKTTTTVSVSKSNISLFKPESIEPTKLPSSISKSSFATDIAIPFKLKMTPKNHSARSSSHSQKPDLNRRSASNMSTRSTPCCTKKKDEFKTNLRKMSSTAGDQTEIENLEKSLETAQTKFLKEIQKLKETSPGKYNCEYKLVTFIRDDQSKLIVKDGELRQLPKKFPAASVNDFKQKLKKNMEDWFSSLKDDLKVSKDTSNADIQKIKDKLEQLEVLKSNDILSYIDDLCKPREDDTELHVAKLKKDLDESNKALRKSEKKIDDLRRQHEEHCLKLEKDLKLKAEADLSKKEGDIKDLQKKLKSQEKQIDLQKTCIQTIEKEFECEKTKLNEELQSCRECVATTNKKLQHSEQQFNHEKKELRLKIERLEIEVEEKKKLTESLAEMTAKVEELQAKVKAKDIPCKECIEHLEQIAELKTKIEALESDRDIVKQQVVDLEKALIDQAKLQDQLKATEQKVQDLQKQLDAKDKLLELTPECNKDLQLELAKFRQCDAEKRREIEKLKSELSKTQFNKCQLEQQIQRDQQLLDVRSELINSLQTNEKNHRIHMEELFAQVGEKNNTINELNAELQTKSEEFRNLFTSLSAKQMEVANQEHIIKLLEESNERSQMLRVKQEEKIGHMEDELAHLKHTISIYQANILNANGGKQLLFGPALPPSTTTTTTTNDYNQNLYYYASQRKRKRHVDINVKKYEA